MQHQGLFRPDSEARDSPSIEPAFEELSYCRAVDQERGQAIRAKSRQRDFSALSQENLQNFRSAYPLDASSLIYQNDHALHRLLTIFYEEAGEIKTEKYLALFR